MNNLYLVHHGILGQKWGVRRYQNKDGTLTSDGKARRLKYGSQKVNLTSEQRAHIMKSVIVGASAVGAGLYIYGSYKTGKLGKNVAIGKEAVKRIINVPKQMNPKFVGPKTAGLVKVANAPTNAAKSLGKGIYKGITKGIPTGSEQMGEQIGKVVGGGITALAVKELADIMNGVDTAQIVIDAYNSHQKKENKVKMPNVKRNNN